ncbi:hypothetical protein C7H19_24740 [Aphanothece hegewaldii CCALA 016]|uniref:DUF389 domain-containing protein n=1 Tax=Aphanothece hegewaldii CCALA 016 TaxID=2107694 RepID=A0A2T1LQS0_9CHRO|nr:DUF389 domain-containing protein [Aphanothece hegewaldii]PSF28224.1 hypothetical protein C7H19_24740 [Aphanothece hegewaldii CCALA 016]
MQPNKSHLLSIDELTHILEENSLPSISFYSLLTLATTIATFGLLGNNAATIIGAMIVAPLMNPIVSLAYGIISGRRGILKQSILTLLTGIIAVILLAFLLSKIVGAQVVGSEIFNRTTPNIVDLGVAIASGAAAGLALSNRNISSALPGVAIAVALVPPLCVVGIGLALGDHAIVDIALNHHLNQSLDVASGAFLLFLTNLAGIIISASVVFLLEQYGVLRKALLGLLITLITLSILSLPLNNRWQEFLLSQKIHREINQFAVIAAQEKDWIKRVDAKDINIEKQPDKILVFLSVSAPKDAISKEDVKQLQQFLTEKNKLPVILEMQVFPFEVFKT